MKIQLKELIQVSGILDFLFSERSTPIELKLGLFKSHDNIKEIKELYISERDRLITEYRTNKEPESPRIDQSNIEASKKFSDAIRDVESKEVEINHNVFDFEKRTLMEILSVNEAMLIGKNFINVV